MKRPALFIAIGAVVVAGGMIIVVFSLLGHASADDTLRRFVVAEGDTVTDIALHLHDDALIKNRIVFSWYVRLQGVEKNIQAGTYALRPSMSVSELVQALTNGETESRERSITILEGWNMDEIGEYLEQQGLLPKSEWLATATVTDSRTIVADRTFTRLTDKPIDATLEGYFFPDTYRVFRDAKPADVIGKTLENFQEKITDALAQQAAEQGKTIYSILTMASILEREVLSDADKKRASGVFWKRIRDGIALQSDATINYVTKKGTTRPSLEDLEVDSLYNTYQHPGLPPGPIGNPGLGSIVAALEPEENDFYYFLTTNDGTAIFSKTFAEHLANKQKYLGS